MVFIDPTSDVAFNRLFGNQARPEIAMSFLNEVLGYKEGQKIVSMTMLDPFNTPDTPWLKTSVVDIRCVDQAGNQYIIEVRVDTQSDYPERSQYYAALALSRQLNPKHAYRKVMPVIFVAVLDFVLFPDNEDCISHHRILNIKTLKHDLRHLEFHFIELPKFEKEIDALSSVTEKWIYFLKHAWEMRTIPSQLKTPEAMQEAFEVLEQGALSPFELAAYDKEVDARRVARSVIETQWEMGITQGKLESQRTMARKLLQKMTPEEVAELTELSFDEVKKLRK